MLHILGGWGTSVLNLQATRTDYVQDKVFDRDFRVILNCQSEPSRIRRIPIEYVLEIPCIMHDASLKIDGPAPMAQRRWRTVKHLLVP